MVVCVDLELVYRFCNCLWLQNKNKKRRTTSANRGFSRREKVGEEIENYGR
jgi:hypothetical protein